MNLDLFASPALLELLTPALRVTGTVLGVFLVLAVVRRAITALENRISAEAERAPRAATLARAGRYLASVVCFGIGGMLVLAELGISIAPLLATAGVAGVALGFGAQALVRDYLAGLYLLVEDQLRVGEVVSVAGHVGTVEELTLRYVRLRDLEGTVYFVPNGEIKVVENRTRSFAYAVLDVRVAYGVELDEAMVVFERTLREAAQDPTLGQRIVDAPELLGVQELADSSVVLRGRVKVVPPLERWNVRRALLRRVKLAFAEAGMEVPYPQVRVHGLEPRTRRDAALSADA